MLEELRGWKETDETSDDACRMIWLMRKAADEIERLRDELADLKGSIEDRNLEERYRD